MKTKYAKLFGYPAAFLLVLGIFLLVRMSGHHGEEVPEQTGLKIGISVYNQYDTFISEMMEALKEHAKTIEQEYGIPVELDIQDAGNNQVMQNDQMSYFIEEQCDIVCINLVDRTDASTIIERGKSANIPVIFFNRELVEEDLERWEKLYYVGAEAFESGILQGELLIETLETDFKKVDRNGDGVIQYVMLEGEAGHQDSIVRTMYAINTVTEAGYEVEKLSDEIANWNRDQAKTKMVQWMQKYGASIEVVFANNDDMALGAVDALEEAGCYENGAQDVPLVLGIDGTTLGREATETGRLLGTVLNDSSGQAKGMLELAYSVVFEKELSSEYTLLDGKYIRLPYQKMSGKSAE